MKSHFSSTMGILGTTVTGTDPRSTGGHPQLQLKKRRLQMNKFRITIKLLVSATFLLAFASLAQAQATRTWVSGVGDDVNPCSRTAPCKTYAGAISKTAAGGEISTLDPGGFGAVTITKSIIIDGTNGSGFGSILASGVNGVNVNDSATGSPNSIKVTLRNLSINGAGTTLGLNGVNYTSGKELVVENCTIDNFSNAGINIALTAAVSGNQRAFITNTTIMRANNGIRAANTAGGGAVNVTVDNVRVSQSTNGLISATSSKVIVRNSTFTNNSQSGIDFQTSSLGGDVENCLMHSNGANGLRAGAGASRIANCYITNNGTAGVNLTGGTVSSYGDNKIDGNGTDVLGGALGGPIGKK
jgi:parallel beta helix pectate lyase-like protein